jgi:hypothetical protein
MMSPPPPRSNKVRWSGRWDQQHDGVVLMVESICEQGFAYAREVEEERQKKLVKTRAKDYKRQQSAAPRKSVVGSHPTPPFIGVRGC